MTRTRMMSESILGKLGVLIVEDDWDTRHLISDILERDGYPSIHTAEDGVGALEELNRHGNEIAVIVLNLFMPRMGGFQLLRLLEELRPPPLWGIVMVTGSLSDHKTEFFATGSEAVLPLHYVKKPFALAELSRCVNESVTYVIEKRSHQFGLHLDQAHETWERN